VLDPGPDGLGIGDDGDRRRRAEGCRDAHVRERAQHRTLGKRQAPPGCSRMDAARRVLGQHNEPLDDVVAGINDAGLGLARTGEVRERKGAARRRCRNGRDHHRCAVFRLIGGQVLVALDPRRRGARHRASGDRRDGCEEQRQEP
jgi:hypothetical protein